MIDTRFYTDLGPMDLGALLDGLAARLPDPKFGDEMIRTASALATAMPGDITFLSDKKQTKDLGNCKATACYVTDALSNDVAAHHIIPIISNHPRAHFSRAVSRLVSRKTEYDSGADPVIAQSAKVHPTAIIGSGAQIGEDVVIGPYTVIGVGVVIGAATNLGAHVSVDCAMIGAECRIKPSTVIGGRGFGVDSDENGLVDLAHIGRVIIGDRVHIGANSCVDRGQLGDTVIGDDVKIDNLVQIAHNVSLGARTMIAGQTGISGSCHVGVDVQMGGNVGLADHLSVGDGARIAARSGVMHNIPAGETWSGIPAQPIRDHMKIVAMNRRMLRPKKQKSE